MEGGRVTICAPILRKKLDYWMTVAKRVEDDMGGSEILNKKRAEREAEKSATQKQTDYILEAYGMDPCDDGDIITWEKQYSLDGLTYSYAALRGGGKWYRVGTDEKLSWVDLMTEVERENILPIAVYRVTEVEVLFEEEGESESN